MNPTKVIEKPTQIKTHFAYANLPNKKNTNLGSRTKVRQFYLNNYNPLEPIPLTDPETPGKLVINISKDLFPKLEKPLPQSEVQEWLEGQNQPDPKTDGIQTITDQMTDNLLKNISTIISDFSDDDVERTVSERILYSGNIINQTIEGDENSTFSQDNVCSVLKLPLAFKFENGKTLNFKLSVNLDLLPNETAGISVPILNSDEIMKDYIPTEIDLDFMDLPMPSQGVDFIEEIAESIDISSADGYNRFQTCIKSLLGIEVLSERDPSISTLYEYIESTEKVHFKAEIEFLFDVAA